MHLIRDGVPCIREHLAGFSSKPETLLAFPQLFLHALAVGNIPDDSHVVGAVDRQRLDGDFDGKRRTILPAMYAFKDHGFLLARLRERFPRGWGEHDIDVRDRQGQELLPAVAEITARPFIDIQEPQSDRVDDFERVVGSVDQAAEQCERVLTLFALGNVLNGAAEPDDAPGGITLDFTTRPHPDGRAIGPNHLEIELVREPRTERLFDRALQLHPAFWGI